MQARIVITDERSVCAKERAIVLPPRGHDFVVLAKCCLEVSQLVIIWNRADAKLLPSFTTPVADAFLLVLLHFCFLRALSIELCHLGCDAFTLDVQRRAILVQAKRIQLLEELLLSCLPLFNRILHTQVHLLELHDLEPLLRVLVLELGLQLLDAIDLVLLVLAELI